MYLKNKVDIDFIHDDFELFIIRPDIDIDMEVLRIKWII